MKFMKVIGLLVMIATIGLTLGACGVRDTHPSVTADVPAVEKVNQFEIIRSNADRYLSSGRAEEFMRSEELHTRLYDDDPKNAPRIFETRNFQTYMIGHICGSICVPWHQMFLTISDEQVKSYFEEVDARSDNEQIVVVSYSGMEGAGIVTAGLNMLGYNAVTLMWGYNQWQFCPDASPGAFFPASTGLGRMTGLDISSAPVRGFWAVGENYPTETIENTTTQTYSFPFVNNTDSTDTYEIIRAAAVAVAQKEKPLTDEQKQQGGWEQLHYWWPTDIIPVDLLNLMTTGNAPFLLDVRPKNLYDKGHIKGAVRMDVATLCKPENLKLLPTDKLIVTISNEGTSGALVSALLRMMGYNSINLLYGMMAWTYSDDIVTNRFHVYEDDMLTFKDVLSYEICWIDVPVAEMLPEIEGYEKPSLYDPGQTEF